MSADIVGFTYLSGCGNEYECSGMILHIKPVTDLIPFTVNRQGFAFKGIEDDKRDELFWEMVWPVVVGAVGYQCWETVGTLPSTYKVV